jgi:hypothetical protein
LALFDHAPVALASVLVVPAALNMVRTISHAVASKTLPELGKAE